MTLLEFPFQFAVAIDAPVHSQSYQVAMTLGIFDVRV